MCVNNFTTNKKAILQLNVSKLTLITIKNLNLIAKQLFLGDWQLSAQAIQYVARVTAQRSRRFFPQSPLTLHKSPTMLLKQAFSNNYNKSQLKEQTALTLVNALSVTTSVSLTNLSASLL